MLLDFEESQLVLVDYQEKLMPVIFESGLFKSAIDFADNAANEAAIAVMEYNKI